MKKDYRFRICYTTGQSDTINIKAENENIAYSKAVKLTIAFSDATGKKFSSIKALEA